MFLTPSENTGAPLFFPSARRKENGPMNLNNVHWRKSSHSGDQGTLCIELATIPGTVAVRDSKDPHGPNLLLPRPEFRRFAETVRSL
jgi:hypothetical protein